jgi:hypothetical protein
VNKAYVETTILTDVLLKPDSPKQVAAQQALARYDETLLPVYAVKECKAGPMDHYAYVHDKLVQTRSLRYTLSAINSLNPVKDARRQSTSREALEAAATLEPTISAPRRSDAAIDEEIADRYRLALASLIVRSWRRRRKVTTRTIQDLECYTEAEPRIGKDGFFDLSPKLCQGDRPCCLWEELTREENVELLVALRNSIPETSTNYEDKNRRRVLKALINTPKIPLMRDDCRWLGDAVFVFYCPADAEILTTNVNHHRPLAKAIGKRAVSP